MKSKPDVSELVTTAYSSAIITLVVRAYLPYSMNCGQFVYAYELALLFVMKKLWHSSRFNLLEYATRYIINIQQFNSYIKEHPNCPANFQWIYLVISNSAYRLVVQWHSACSLVLGIHAEGSWFVTLCVLMVEMRVCKGLLRSQRAFAQAI